MVHGLEVNWLYQEGRDGWGALRRTCSCDVLMCSLIAWPSTWEQVPRLLVLATLVGCRVFWLLLELISSDEGMACVDLNYANCNLPCASSDLMQLHTNCQVCLCCHFVRWVKLLLQIVQESGVEVSKECWFMNFMPWVLKYILQEIFSRLIFLHSKRIAVDMNRIIWECDGTRDH